MASHLLIEPGQGDLSRILSRMWGEPEKYKGVTEARAGTRAIST